VTGLDGLGATLIPWVSNHKVGSIPIVTTMKKINKGLDDLKIRLDKLSNAPTLEVDYEGILNNLKETKGLIFGITSRAKGMKEDLDKISLAISTE
jgi:hypothetical protein